MTITNAELMYAILAMDSYNRGYNVSINVEGTSVGSATISNDSLILNSDTNDSNRVDQGAGFYAIAYSYEGETVISYRGTDELFDTNSDIGGDVWNGYSTGGGAPFSTPALLAAEFYQEMTRTTSSEPSTISVPYAPATLTGHSLGGGLAGFIASVYDKDAVIFDNMPFKAAAQAAYDAAISPVGQF